MRRILLSLLYSFLTIFATAQNHDDALAKQLVTKNAGVIGLSQDDLNNYLVSNSYFNQSAGTQMVYLQQSYKGLPIYNQLLVLAFKDQKLISKAGGFLSNLGTMTSARSASPGITPDAAVRTAITEAGIAMPSFVIVLKTLEPGRKYDFGKLNNLTTENVTAELMWVPVRDFTKMNPASNKIAPNIEATGNKGDIIAVKLAWQVQLVPKANADYWNIRVDATTNTVIEKNNLTVYENHNLNQFLVRPRESASTKTSAISIPGVTAIDGPTLVNTANYTVIPYPAESPNHPGGTAAIRTNPWTLAGGNAVTLGWHNDGAADYTYSRGNNVWAQEDRDNNNATNGIPANSTTTPDPLNFTYPINYTTPPITADFQQFATTNLFYWNNLLHDLNYNYGFTEPAGNFQANNLGRGGAQNDYVVADAQDAGGTNNANMSTPADGGRPRMQMYLWNPAAGVLTFVVNTPPGIAGPYNAVEGAFSINNLLGNVGPVTGDLVWYNDDAAGNTHYACNAPVNSVAGKVALVVRGFGGAVCTATVPFTQKVLNAQNAGAIAVIVVNNVPGPPIPMGGADNTITIPAIMISDVDGATIAAQLASNVNVTLSSTPPGTIQLDGDIDNGIIAHEFSHGVSNRLTGGPATAGCLSNAEQGGEGWGDYQALMITTNWATALPTDGASKQRTMGTYAAGQTINGAGIRLYPYCTNIAINPLTYASLGVAPVGTEVHNVGEVWCMAIWEMTWGLIQTDGINPNIFNAAGTGGNTVAYRLVMEGMKLQPCSPGFLDARNAILQADQNLYGGAHYCTIWAAFAKRGMGVNAVQGSAFNAADQVADFTVPAGANITAQPANSTACNGTATSFTVGTTGGGTVTYQWQVSTTGAGGPWSNVTNAAPYSGATTLTLSVNPVTNAMNGYQYRLVITSACGTTTSNPAVLTVIAAAVGGTVTPASTTVCSLPNSITLTLAGNVGPVARWESSTTGAGGPFTTPIANTTNTLTVTNVAVTTWYRAVIQAAGCTAANSSVAVVTVLPGALQMYIVADPGTTVCAGDPTRLTAMESAGITPITVSHSSNNTTITALNSVACPTPPTSIWRAYNLTTFPAVTSNFTITTVRFGIEAAIPATQNITVNLYNQTGAAFPGGTRTLIRTQVFPVTSAQSNTVYTATFTTPVIVPNTSTVIVEIVSTVANGFFIGSNTAAESGPTYISAAGCGLANPGTVASVGFPNMHAILYLTGTVQTPGTQVSGGTFTWSPAAGLSSTSTNPVAASPATTTTYTVVHDNGAGCIRTASILINVNQRPAVTTQPTNTTVCLGSSATFTGAATGTGITYQWQVSTTGAGGPWTNLTNTAPYSGVTTTTLTVSPVTMAMNGYQYRLVVSGTCPVPANSNGAILTVNALPTVTITPAGPICGGIQGVNGVMLTTGGGILPPVPGSVNVNSGPISIPIPDPSPGMNPTTNVLNVTGIPANATITGVSVTWTLPHTYPADLVINLKAPNNNILSLYKHNTQTDNGAASVPTAGFFDAVVNNTSAVQFKSVPTPYRYGVTAPAGPYAPDVLNGSTNPGYPAGSDPVGYVSNATGFSGLYTTGGSANGAWTLAMADAGGGDAGTLQNWQIKIDYTTPNPSVPISYTWSPATGLYTDPNATIPYVTGTQTPTVYAAPTTNTVYTVTALENATGCTNTATVTVNYTPNAPTVNPTSATMCLGDAAVPLTITSSLAPTIVTLTNSTPVAIPDNTANGVTSVINVAGVPVGAVISSMAVTLNMPHTYPADMVFNLRAPNGQILNLFKHNTNTNSGAASEPTAGFFNAVVNSTGTVIWSAVPAPYRYGITVPVGPFRPDALNGAIVNPGYTIMDPAGFASTAANFAALYSTPNGAWTLAMCDGGPADLGTLNSWTLSFTYGSPAGGIWTPNGAGSGLFNDAAATSVYTGTSVQTVYAKPAVSTTYSVTVSTATCTSPARAVPVTVNNPIVVSTISANQNICTDKVASFSVTVTGTSPTYQWEVSTDVGNTWNIVNNGGVYSGATTATLTITAPPVSMSGYLYRAVVSGAAPCAAATSALRSLTVNPLPTILISANPYTRLLPGMVTNLTSVVTPSPAGTGGYTWLRDGIPVPGASAGSLSVSVDGLGDYSLRVTDVNGCTNTSNTISIRDSASGKCFIYPNPNSGQFQVRYYSAMGNTGLPRTLTVFDGKGDRVFSQNYSIGQPYDRMDVDMRKYGKGLYWVEVSDMNGNRLTMCRIVIQ